MSYYDYQLRIVLSGETGVGKSCLLNQLCNGEFIIPSLTVGVDQTFYNCEYKNKKIKLQIIDTAGNHRFRGITKSYYKGVAAAIIVYDITQYNTFRQVNSWLEDCILQCDANTTLILLGNKCDIEDKREVPKKEGSDFADRNNMLFFEVSAVNKEDILTVINFLIESVYCRVLSGKTILSETSGVRDPSMEPNILNYDDISVHSD